MGCMIDLSGVDILRALDRVNGDGGGGGGTRPFLFGGRGLSSFSVRNVVSFFQFSNFPFPFSFFPLSPFPFLFSLFLLPPPLGHFSSHPLCCAFRKTLSKFQYSKQIHLPQHTPNSHHIPMPLQLPRCFRQSKSRHNHHPRRKVPLHA